MTLIEVSRRNEEGKGLKGFGADPMGDRKGFGRISRVIDIGAGLNNLNVVMQLQGAVDVGPDFRGRDYS